MVWNRSRPEPPVTRHGPKRNHACATNFRDFPGSAPKLKVGSSPRRRSIQVAASAWARQRESQGTLRARQPTAQPISVATSTCSVVAFKGVSVPGVPNHAAIRLKERKAIPRRANPSAINASQSSKRRDLESRQYRFSSFHTQKTFPFYLREEPLYVRYASLA